MKTTLLYIMAFFYILAGSFHFINPAFYLRMMPPYIPFHSEVIIVSGIIEILLGIFLIPKFTRRQAAWGIVLLLIAVYPANIQMFLDAWKSNNPKLWVTIVRLPFQFLFIWWAWIYTRTDKNHR
ncbi:DoxX-like family protein [Leptospira inadai serovar Lyme str. 10]|uniref:DoxX-like family protein n=2 Tax=Leptospira inadai serovar Lyme TaxID=293084 RepID=V6HQJ0_9LEPT|nr:DoxX family protein [Leptospira inadai]EQA34699.1 DoxX-like family protein [Leptospira inadai serovar Lyme str. 10]PNV76041.1 DoxX family protein [Leptospira inadai serovar Lyme]